MAPGGSHTRQLGPRKILQPPCSWAEDQVWKPQNAVRLTQQGLPSSLCPVCISPSGLLLYCRTRGDWFLGVVVQVTGRLCLSPLES